MKRHVAYNNKWGDSPRCNMFQRTVPYTRLALAVLALAFLSAEVHSQEPNPPRVLVVRLEDQIIHPVTARFVTRALAQARERGDPCVIIQLDTPGGLMDSTRHLVKEILTSEVPVVVYIAPSGARAGSAGVFIALAAHVAVMAPGTNIGAAHPITLGGGPLPGGDGDPARNAGKNSGQQILSEKITNDAVAWARALAEHRGRNSAWAIRAVRDSISTPAQEAWKEHVVDFLAVDQNDLLIQLESRKIPLTGGSVVLHTKGAVVDRKSVV